MPKTVFLDWSNAAYRCLFVAMKNDPFDDKLKGWKRLMFSSTLDTLKTHEPDELVVAGDGGNPWRRNFYEGYKGNRSKSRENFPVDYVYFHETMDGYWDEMKAVFTNFKWMKMDGVEADDVIGVLVKNAKNECVAVTTDKDFVQLLKYPNFHLYNPIAGQEVKSMNPRMDLDVKCICGDKSDNIEGIKKGVGPKTAERLLTEGTFDEYLDANPQVKEKYVLNRRLIDMDNIPMDVQERIMAEYGAIEAKPPISHKLWGFMTKNAPDASNNLCSVSNLISKVG